MVARPVVYDGSQSGRAGGGEAVATGLPDRVAAAVVLVVRGDVADAGVQPHRVVLAANAVELVAELAGIAAPLEVRPLALDMPNRDSIHAWSVGVEGRPNRCMIAQAAMNSRVECDRICGPLSLIASSTGTRSSTGASGSLPPRSRSNSAASSSSSRPSAASAAVKATSICVLVSSAETTVASHLRETTSSTATATRLA